MARKHIQVIDDEATVRVYLRTLLEREGYRVSEVDNPMSVTHRDRMNPPDMVIIALNMPGMDGFEVCAELRRGGDFSAPIVALSGRTDEASRRSALAAGADAYITKPIDSDLLLRTVSGLLSSCPESQSARTTPPAR